MSKFLLCAKKAVYRFTGTKMPMQGTIILCDTCGHYELSPEALECLGGMSEQARARIREYVQQTYVPLSGVPVTITTETIRAIAKVECIAIPKRYH